jgi:uncharacterized membrane protein YvbJ
MYCPACGVENQDTAAFCADCGERLPHGEASSPKGSPVRSRRGDVPNYLVPTILVTIFCCLPFGIVAIVFAAQVNGKVERGDHEGALQASKRAKLWSWISFGAAPVLILAIVL